MAYSSSNCYILALEEWKDIFNAILKPMKKSTQIVVMLPPPLKDAILEDLDDMPVQPQILTRKGKFNK